MIFEVLTLILIKEKQMSEIANLGSTQLKRLTPKNPKPPKGSWNSRTMESPIFS